MKTMHKYPELGNLDNILLEIADGGAVTSEDIGVLLNIAIPTASNVLRSSYIQGYLTRKNINPHEKFGGPTYQYGLTMKGQKRIILIRETKLA